MTEATSMDRREFLAGLLASSTAFAADKEPTMFPIIDTHQHLWDLDKFQLPWLTDTSPLKRNYLPADYQKAIDDVTAPAKVVKSVYMEVDVAPAQQQAEADYVIGLCKAGNTPMVAAVVSGRPASDDFGRYVKQFKGSPYVKGLRQVLHSDRTPAGYCLDPKFVAGIRLLGELGLSFDLCIRPTDLPDAAKLIDHCPDTRFILDHCGNGDVKSKDLSQWRKDMAEVARRKNVVGKVSGIVAAAAKGWKADDLAPVINHTLEVFGPDRVMYGGDWPVCTLAATYQQWVDALRQVVRERKAEEQRKLFHDNAAKFYGIA